MRPPSENLRRRASTFHSISVGGRFVGLLKKISYSIFRRRSCESSTVSSSSSVTGFSGISVESARPGNEVPVGHGGGWYESKARPALPMSHSEYKCLRSQEHTARFRGKDKSRCGISSGNYFEEFDAIFLTMARTSLRSLSLRLVE